MFHVLKSYKHKNNIDVAFTLKEILNLTFDVYFLRVKWYNLNYNQYIKEEVITVTKEQYNNWQEIIINV